MAMNKKGLLAILGGVAIAGYGIYKACKKDKVEVEPAALVEAEYEETEEEADDSESED